MLLFPCRGSLKSCCSYPNAPPPGCGQLPSKDTSLYPLYPPLLSQLPWKSNAQLVEYYYMWKTTDRYVQQKRVKAAEAESRLKQVYIPNYNKPNPAALSNGKMVNGAGGPDTGRPCAGCAG